MSHAERQANAVGGRTARACDGCIRRRARWYCPADDAFLCQACDTSVHSANPLARRHDRVRLKTSSSSSASLLKSADAAPAWHHGFTRKARTPRHHHHGKTAFPKAEPLVPDLEMSGDDNNVEEEQLLYRVPIFDPVLAEFCSPSDVNPLIDEGKPAGHLPPSTAGSDGLAGFNPADMELAEFAADVESLLGQGVDDDQFCIEGLGLLELREGDVDCSVADSGRVKTELDAEGCQLDIEMELSRETMDINFDYASASTVEEFEVGKVEEPAMFEEAEARRFTLSLDHDAVIAACSSLGCSPWTDGMRPQLNLDDWWPDYMGMWGGGGAEAQEMYGEVGRAHGVGDGGREARVTRYREKRRTRLFSKKILYEVRKLNAEKRPRMKGRFVKRASFQPAAVPGFPY